MVRTLRLMDEENEVAAGRGPAVTTVDMLVTEGLATWTIVPCKQDYTLPSGRVAARLDWAAEITTAGLREIQ